MITSNYWRLMFALPAIVAALQLFLLLAFFKHETPCFSLLVNDDEKGALQLLSKSLSHYSLEKIYYDEDVPKVLSYIRENNKQSGNAVTLIDLILEDVSDLRSSPV